jgi:hypothetical protein
VSCSVQKSSQTSVSSSDSVRERVEIHQQPVTIPQETATLPQLSISTLRDLPEGAGYHVKKGRLTLGVSKRDGKLDITAEADSVTALVPLKVLRSIEHKTLQTETTKKADVHTGLLATLTRPLSLLIIVLLTLTAIILWHKIFRPLKSR